MPRPRKGPHLYLKRRERFGRESVWIIRDGPRDKSTGCGAADLAGAERALQAYIAGKYTPPKAGDRLEAIPVAAVMQVYLAEHAPTVARPDFIEITAAPILDWWGTQTLADIRGKTCRDYVDWRTAKGVSDQTARHDLKTLRAAINYYHREYGPLPAVPAVTLPDKAEPRERWLTRDDAAAMIRAARRLRYHRYVARIILIGVYTGTRPGALLRLKWLPSPQSGWFDLENGVLYRRGSGERVTKKRRMPARIPERLMPHLRRWRAMDMAGDATGSMGHTAKNARSRRARRAGGAKPIVHAVHYYGRPVNKLRRSWASVCKAAGVGEDVVPHTLRHTAATWLMQAGVDVFEAAGFLSMSPETLLDVYGHHHPNFQEQAARAQFKRKARRAGEPRNAEGTGPVTDPKTPAKGRQHASADDSQVANLKGKTG
jgi:integrase